MLQLFLVRRGEQTAERLLVTQDQSLPQLILRQECADAGEPAQRPVLLPEEHLLQQLVRMHGLLEPAVRPLPGGGHRHALADQALNAVQIKQGMIILFPGCDEHLGGKFVGDLCKVPGDLLQRILCVLVDLGLHHGQQLLIRLQKGQEGRGIRPPSSAQRMQLLPVPLRRGALEIPQMVGRIQMADSGDHLVHGRGRLGRQLGAPVTFVQLFLQCVQDQRPLGMKGGEISQHALQLRPPALIAADLLFQSGRGGLPPGQGPQVLLYLGKQLLSDRLEGFDLVPQLPRVSHREPVR